MKLYEIATQYQQALATLDDLDLPDEVIADTLEGLKGELQEKGKNVAAYIKNLEVDVKAIKDAEQAMKDRRLVLQRRVDWMKTLLLNSMQNSEITEISCPWFVIKPKKNPPAVHITDAAKLSKKYKIEVVDYKIDKKLIAADLKKGALVNGAEMTQGWRLDIK